jgi:NAD-dependent DNA ligase
MAQRDYKKKYENIYEKKYENITLKELECFIEKCCKEYYNKGITLIDGVEITDVEYDIAYDILKKRNPTSAILKKFGSEPDTKEKVKLPFPITSLNKYKTEKQIESWCKKYKGPYHITPKIDGIACIIYNNKMYTKGDSVYAQDITHILSVIKLPLPPNDTCIRGELYMEKKVFKQYENEYKNSRAICSGQLRQSKTYDKQIVTNIKFKAHSIVYPRYKHDEQFTLLQKYGYDIVEQCIVNELFFTDLVSNIIERRVNSPFDTDGLVIADTSSVYELTDGNPKHAFAFKYDLPDQTAQSVVEGITWNVTKDNYIVPVLNIKPVEVGGVVISNVTGNNYRFIKDSNLGVGSKIMVIRSGDVIPKIFSIIQQSDVIPMPTFPYVVDEVHLKSTGDTDQHKIKSIVHFFKTLGVKYISDGIVGKLIDKYDSFINIIHSDSLKDIIGQKLSDKIQTEIKTQLENCKLSCLMSATNVFPRGFAEKKLESVLDMYPEVKTYLTDNKVELEYEERKVKGISSKSLTEFFHCLSTFKNLYKTIYRRKFASPIDIQQIMDGVSTLTIPDVNKTCSSVPAVMSGQSIVFTNCRNKQLEEWIEQRGGKVTNTVTGKTTLVIYKGMEVTEKLKKASEKGVETITLQQFTTKYNINI